MSSDKKQKQFRWTAEAVRTKGLELHKGRFSYVNVMDPINSTSEITIKCNDCNENFESTIKQHFSSPRHCPNCSEYARYNYDRFIKKARKVHSRRYSYPELNRDSEITAKKRILIVCRICSYSFRQVVKDHINKQSGCLRCKGRVKLTYDEFIKNAQLTHGDAFDYSNILPNDEISSEKKVSIKCNKCGNTFLMKAGKHIVTKWCKICKGSKGEQTIMDYLKTHNINYITQFRLPSMPNRRFDFMLPNKNCIIEFDGGQHFKFVEKFHKTPDGFEQSKIIDVLKSVEALLCGYILIRISCDINEIKNILDVALETNKKMYISHKDIYEAHINRVVDIIPEVTCDCYI